MTSFEDEFYPNQGHYEHKILSHNVPRRIKDSVLSALHKTVLRERSNVYVNKFPWLKREMRIEKKKVSEQAWRFSSGRGQNFCLRDLP